MTTPTLLPWRGVKAIVERLNTGTDTPTFTEHAIRHYVRCAKSNGLSPYESFPIQK